MSALAWRWPLAAAAILLLPLAAAAQNRSDARGTTPLVSPDIAADGRVTFRLRAPEAREVIVRGFGPRLVLRKDQTGVWSATSEPLPPDIYLYNFIVDGTSTLDPANTQTKTLYPSGAQSVFHVTGAVIWEPAATSHGEVSRHTYHSAIVGDDRDYYVYTPPQYDPKRRAPYPVLYLLHGLTDDASGWITVGAANVILDNLIAQDKAVPMVLVCPLGYGSPAMLRGGLEDVGGAEMMPAFAESLLREVMPRVESTYHVSTDRRDRAIAGLSMGGAEALFTGLNHLDTFAWVASFSGAYNMWPGMNVNPGDAPAAFARVFPHANASVNARLSLLWLACGLDDLLYGINEAFGDWLTARHVRFTDVSVPDHGHVWKLWRQNLADLAPLLFRP